MKNVIESVNQSGWTGIVLYGLILCLIVLFFELNDKKQSKVFVNGRWIENDFDPIGFRIFFAGCLFFGGVAFFFILKSLVL